MKDTILSLKGKIAVVTGGTGGLGSGIVKGFLAQGAQVIALGTSEKKAAALRESIDPDLSENLTVKLCNINDADRVTELMDYLSGHVARVDILVNSAGINQLLPLEDYDDETFQKVMDLNLTALHRITREIGRRFMIPQKYGRIIHLSSVKSFVGTDRNYIAYCASKGAVNMYTKQCACEWGKYGITCNAIAPTFVRTPINSFQLDDPIFYQSLIDRIPLGRIGREEDIANAALFLASDASSFITGQILAVDGGLTAKQ